MPAVSAKPLDASLCFGARITGISSDTLKDSDIRKLIRDTFEDRGLIIFEGVEPTSEMQVELSNVLGPLQEHSFKGITLVDKDRYPGLIEFDFDPQDADIFEVDGKQLINFLPWHFDACYAKHLNRGAVLRSVIIPPEGGLTGFADGVQLYQALPSDLRNRVEGLSIVYQAALMQMNQRFGLPKSYRVVRSRERTLSAIKMNEAAPKTVHPVVWRRASGEPVLHVSPWQAARITGHETPEGDTLLEELCQSIYQHMVPYWHRWKPTDMLAWDNWRFLHSVSGQDPAYSRRVHRTTIEGDYGLGRFYEDFTTGSTSEMTAPAM